MNKKAFTNKSSFHNVSARNIILFLFRPILLAATLLSDEDGVKAFTLIELLVVVLIIDILSAVALPQYQKAVWKSRAAEMIILVSSLGRTAQSYLLANFVVRCSAVVNIHLMEHGIFIKCRNKNPRRITGGFATKSQTHKLISHRASSI